MENYIKDKVVEVEDNSVPFGDYCPPDVCQMRVRSATNCHNIVDFAAKKLVSSEPNCQSIVITGTDKWCHKVITCAELIKRKVDHKLNTHLFQMTQIGYKCMDELWTPKEDTGLDALKVVRKIPKIDILLSKEPLDESAPGVQHKHVNVFTQSSTQRHKPNRNAYNKSKPNKNYNKSKPKTRTKSPNESNNKTETNG